MVLMDNKIKNGSGSMTNMNEEIARGIVECFEDLLERKGIEIPCESESEEKDRHDGDGAPIYGTEYGDLCETVAEILANGYGRRAL